MPKKKIDISQCNAEDLRFKPFNLLWGGPLLVEDRRLQKRRLAKQAKANQIAAADNPQAAAEAQSEAQPEEQPETQPEAPPPEEPTQSTEAAETPEAAAAEPKEDKTEEAKEAKETKEDKMEKKTKKKKHNRKSRHDYDYDTDTDSSGSSLFRREHRSAHGHHRSKCCCKHDDKTDKHKATEKKGAHALRCPVCRQHVNISSSDDDEGVGEKKIKRSHASKRDKKKKTTGKEEKKREEKGGDGDGVSKEGEKKDEKEATPAAAEENKTETAAADGPAETPVDANDAGAVEPDNNVAPTAQDVVPPLPSSASANDHRADLSAALFDYPSPTMLPGLHPGFHDSLAYRPGPSYAPYPYPYPVPYPTFGFPYPSYPAYPYAPPPPVVPPPVPFLPPHMMPPPMVPYPPPGDVYTDVDTYEHKSAAKTTSEGGMADSGAAWHDMAGGAGAGDGVKEPADAGNDEEDEWGIHWKPPVMNDGNNGNSNWGINPCGVPESGDHARAGDTAPSSDQNGTAWTPDDLAMLGRLHEERISDQWRELQTAFYNATGRVVDPEVLKSKIEQGIDKQGFEQQDPGNLGGGGW